MTPRAKRFLARIDTERSIIGVVNSSIVGKDFPLAGLSAGAIADWRRRVTIALPRSVVHSVGEILKDASKHAGFMSDNSRIVFDPEFKSDATWLEELRHELVRLLPSD